MLTKETTNAGKLGKLQKLSAALAANTGDLPNLQGSIAQFATLVAQAQDVATKQAALIAQKQEASLELQAALVEGARLSTVLQLAVKQHYGIRAEKLAEFGLPPFRGRNKTAKATPGTPAPAPKPSPAPEVHAAPSRLPCDSSSPALRGVLPHAPLFLSSFALRPLLSAVIRRSWRQGKLTCRSVAGFGAMEAATAPIRGPPGKISLRGRR